MLQHVAKALTFPQLCELALELIRDYTFITVKPAVQLCCTARIILEASFDGRQTGQKHPCIQIISGNYLYLLKFLSMVDNDNNNNNNNNQGSSQTTSSTTTTETTQFPRVISEREMTKGEEVDYSTKCDSHFTPR
jgi:hypothetical protein